MGATGASRTERVGITVRYTMEAFDRHGRLKWRDGFSNLVVTAGRNALLDNTFNAVASAVTWYVGLKGTGTVAAGDTMASHSGWSEVTAYDEGARPAWTKNGAAASGSTSNSSSKASFTISSTVSVYGAFLSSDSAKSGTAGVLFGAGDFSSSKSLEDGDVLNVQADISLTSS